MKKALAAEKGLEKTDDKMAKSVRFVVDSNGKQPSEQGEDDVAVADDDEDEQKRKRRNECGRNVNH